MFLNRISFHNLALAFLQAEPWQWPYAKVHFTPFFLQVQRPELQSVVQSQRMIFKKSAGAGGRSVKMGTNPDSVTSQPHDSSLRVQWRLFH